MSAMGHIRMRLGPLEFKDRAVVNFAIRWIPVGPNVLIKGLYQAEPYLLTDDDCDS